VAAVDLPERATPLEPGEPVEMPAVSQMGGTFAERKAAREELDAKAVSGSKAENKSVDSSESKSRPRRRR
jgi:hypothetical protein